MVGHLCKMVRGVLVPRLAMHAQWSVPNWFNGTQLVGAMMLEQNDEWSLNRCYMQLEGLQTL